MAVWLTDSRSNTSKRLRVYCFPYDFVADVFWRFAHPTKWERGSRPCWLYSLPELESLPSDAVLLAVSENTMSRSLDFLFCHDSFDEVPNGVESTRFPMFGGKACQFARVAFEGDDLDPPRSPMVLMAERASSGDRSAEAQLLDLLLERRGDPSARNDLVRASNF